MCMANRICNGLLADPKELLLYGGRKSEGRTTNLELEIYPMPPDRFLAGCLKRLRERALRRIR